jgi:Tol biopolymer transport system component
MAVGPGARLETYEIVALLGSGGMGEVWLARDLRLDRNVAVKVLAPALTQDPIHVARFRQEARTASSLNHPNICAIHTLGTADDGRLFIAMEYVEGATLRDRLSAARLTIAEALEVGIQIASALSAAHTAGVIHRDLKPENVMIRPDGLIKVLDFGLAKLASTAETENTDLTHTMVRTRAGAVVGTASYMSPEQARGETLDARTDLFSLGAVLYEMVTSTRAFAGRSEAVIFEATLNRAPPPVLRLNPHVPPRLDEIISKALEKNRELRYQTASDLRADLKRVERDTGAAISAPLTQPDLALVSRPPPRRWVLVAAVVMAALAGVGVAWYAWRVRLADIAVDERQLTSNSSEAAVLAAAISPDGKYLAYADVAGLHIRQIDTGETHLLATPAMAAVNRLVWFSDGGTLLESGVSHAGEPPAVWAISVFGGAPRKLRDDAFEASVSADGTQIVFVNAQHRELWRMQADGSDAERLFAATDGDLLRLPSLRSLRRVGYGRVHQWANASGAIRTEVRAESRDLQTGNTTVVISDPGLTGGIWLSDNRLIYAVVAAPITRRAASLWEARLDPATGRMAGSARRIRVTTLDRGGALSGFSASTDGNRIVYLKGSPQDDVYVGDLKDDGDLANTRRLTLDDSEDYPTNWSPEGTAVLFHSNRNGTFDIFKQGVQERSADPIVATGEDEMGPAAISPDGRWFFYHVHQKGWQLTSLRPMTLMRVSASGGPAYRVIEAPSMDWPSCARSPSTRCVLAQRRSNQMIFSALDPMRGKGPELARTDVGSSPFYPSDLSPDGSQIAMVLPNEGRIRVLSLTGAPAHDVVVTGRSLNSAQPFTWSADRKGWYVSSTSAEGTDLLFVDAGGHARVLRHQTIPEPMVAIPSPDGRHLAFSERTSINNAWMIEGH